MGGVTAATTTAAALTANNMLSQRREQEQQLGLMKKQQNQAVSNKKNILEQQLAQRRAVLGSMGVSLDGSNAAAQQGIIKEGYQDIYDTNEIYDEKYRNLYNSYNRDFVNSIVNQSQKILK